VRKSFVERTEYFLVQFVVHLTVSEMGQSITSIWAASQPEDNPSIVCNIQALFRVMFAEASILWHVALAFFLWQLSSCLVISDTPEKKNATISRLHWAEKASVMVCWGVPLLLVALVSAGDSWEPGPYHLCGFKENWMLVAFYGAPLLFCQVLSMVVLLIAVINYRRVKNRVIATFEECSAELREQWGEEDSDSHENNSESLLPSEVRAAMLRGRNLIIGFLLAYLGLQLWSGLGIIVSISSAENRWFLIAGAVTEALDTWGNFAVYFLVYFAGPVWRKLWRTKREASDTLTLMGNKN